MFLEIFEKNISKIHSDYLDNFKKLLSPVIFPFEALFWLKIEFKIKVFVIFSKHLSILFSKFCKMTILNSIFEPK